MNYKEFYTHELRPDTEADEDIIGQAGKVESIIKARMQSPGRLISRIARRARMYITPKLQALGVGAGQYVVLITLLQHDGCSQDELASFAALDKSCTARALSMLEEDGFITRTPVAGNRRKNRVYATDKARVSAENICCTLDAADGYLTQGLSPAEQAQLVALLRKVEKNVQAF